MIELALYFALGFLLAGLLALMVLPAIWRRAVRLTKRRIEASTPLSLAEIKASRDQLRAEFARETRRLELAAGELRRRAAERQIEASRSRDRLDAVSAERDETRRKLETTEAERTAVAGALAKVTEERTAALQANEAQAAEFNDLKVRLADMLADLDARKLEIATLRTSIQSLEARVVNITDEQRRTVTRAELAETELDKRESLLADTRERLQRAEAALADRAREFTLKTEQLRATAEKLAAAEARLAAAEAVPVGDNVRRSVEELERSNAELEATVRRLAAERDALAAQAGREGRAPAPATGPAEPAAAPGEIGLLRERLADLAAQLVVLTGDKDRGELAAPPVENGAAAPAGAVPSARPAADEDATVFVPGPARAPSLADRIRALQQDKRPPDATTAG
ncbi:hypothetical protein [Prosthecomicrobium sp. N25]|uniref:hypothetical protein n=1 Tax=Prosthecomicrobium sp. N25 TaxID=3129254 RepID=UPI0030781D9B